ncbi:sulfite reductase subunit beta, partial [Vibrio parahaemolyticus]|nr:sulfite reductase subunit beta [Vibrio parahaemolyticus]
IGLVVKAPGRYNLHVGGNSSGTRVPKMYKEKITDKQILEEIDLLVARWSKEREEGEYFGDVTILAGIIQEVFVSKRDFYA